MFSLANLHLYVAFGEITIKTFCPFLFGCFILLGFKTYIFWVKQSYQLYDSKIFLTFFYSVILSTETFFKRLFIYLMYIEKRHNKQEERAGRGSKKQAPCWVGTSMWGSIPGPWDHDPNLRPSQLSHPCAPLTVTFIMLFFF